MKPNLKSVVVCFIAAPLATLALFAGADSAGLEPDANSGSAPRFEDQDSRGRGEREREREHPLLALGDVDRNGVLSTAEIQAMPKVLLTFDVNGDGILDGDEMREAIPPPPPPRGGRGDGMGPPRGGRSEMGPGGFPFRGE